jgi:hypothetical protein
MSVASRGRVAGEHVNRTKIPSARWIRRYDSAAQRCGVQPWNKAKLEEVVAGRVLPQFRGEQCLAGGGDVRMYVDNLQSDCLEALLEL